MKNSDVSRVDDMIILCSTAVGSETAQKGVRALCRHFGGRLVYVPVKKDDGRSAEKIRGVLVDAVGDRPAQKMLDCLMIGSGGLQIYIPFEYKAFKKIIGLEIYERNQNGESMDSLAADYRISFNHAYTLWRIGQREKYDSSLPYLPFLELSYNNSN
jgi:Mor family transcriptional regulator